MKLNRYVAALISFVMALGLVAMAQGEITPLPMDDFSPGFIPDPKGSISRWEYQDESISVKVVDAGYKGVKARIARIKIAHPSQLRTALSADDFDVMQLLNAQVLTRKYHPVFAMNGDFVKYVDYGYVIRQSTLYRNAPDGEHDVLLIDSNGDFHTVPAATTESIEAFLATLPQGVSIVNTFNFGPVLVKDGNIVQLRNDMYSAKARHMRIAIGQTGPLEYAVYHCDGKADTSKGMDLEKFSEFILFNDPDVKIVYNMDGGGSARAFIMDRVLFNNPNPRNICDLLYFASAVAPEEAQQ